MIKLAAAELPVMQERIAASPDAAAAIAGCQTVPDAIEALAAGGFLAEATRLLAHALPRREGVWWACMCSRHTALADISPADTAALEAAELWVRRPTDENRRDAFAKAEAAGFKTAECWAAVAAFWSGESMSPASAPPVPPGPQMAGAALAGAIALAAVRGKVERQDARLKNFLTSGRDVAGGGPGRLPHEDA